MPALVTGKTAPDFTLTTTDGKSVNLQELLRRGPVVLAFFKVSCPVWSRWRDRAWRSRTRCCTRTGASRELLGRA